MQCICKYDAKGKPIEFAWYNASGALTSKWINKYDDTGNVIECAMYNEKGALINIKTVSYTYY